MASGDSRALQRNMRDTQKSGGFRGDGRGSTGRNRDVNSVGSLLEVDGCGRLQVRFTEARQFVRRVPPGGVTSMARGRYPRSQQK